MPFQKLLDTEPDIILELYHIHCPDRSVHEWFCERIIQDVTEKPFSKTKYSSLLNTTWVVSLVLLFYKERKTLMECKQISGVGIPSLRKLRETLRKTFHYDSRKHLREELMEKLPAKYLTRTPQGQIFAHGIPVGTYVRMKQGYKPDTFILPDGQALAGFECFQIVSSEVAKENPWGTGTYRCGGQYLLELHTNFDSSD